MDAMDPGRSRAGRLRWTNDGTGKKECAKVCAIARISPHSHSTKAKGKRQTQPLGHDLAII